MKNVPKAFKFKPCIFYYLLCISLVLLSACGSGGSGDDAVTNTSAGQGTLSFSLNFEEPNGNSTTVFFLAARSPSGDICVDYEIETIDAYVIDSSGARVAEGSWDCSEHQGTIKKVPTGSGIILNVFGTNKTSNGHWNGQIRDLTVFADEYTNAGEVDMKWEPGVIEPPEVVSTKPSDGETGYPIDAAITATFSKDMVPASLENEDIEAFTLETETTPVEGGVTYNTDTRIATFKPTNELSYCTTYTATVAADVEDRTGQKMTDEFTWRFTTLADDTNPNTKWYKDSDRDLYGDPNNTIAACTAPEGYVADNTDCNDEDANIYPGATEVCDGLDNNCDGSVPSNEADGDGDGFRLCAGDCNDGNNSIYPGATEICDGLDNNCDGSVPSNEADRDRDGFRVCAGDCNDGNNSIYPGATEVCDGLDNNCDGSVPSNEADGDGDGFRVCAGDCNDGNNSIYPGATEVCDGLDNDCDDQVDEGVLSIFYADNDGDFYGDPSNTREACTAPEGWVADNTDCDDTDATIYPGAAELLCDGIDQDCDGSDFCEPTLFDFEELTPTYVGQELGDPRLGSLTILIMEKPANTITIIREGETNFDTSDNQKLIQTKPAAFGQVSLDPHFDSTSPTAFIVNFSFPVSSVQVDMGDYNTIIEDPIEDTIQQDDDTLLLEAYNASGKLLDRDQFELPDTPSEEPSFSFESLFVAAPVGECIGSVKMIGGSTSDPISPNSVFYDNIIVRPCGSPE